MLRANCHGQGLGGWPNRTAFVDVLPVTADDRERRATFSSNVLQSGQGFGLLLGHNHWHIGLDDAPFLVGDLGQCVAQQLGVVEAQAGDDRYQRRQDVGGIQPPTQPNLCLLYTS